MDPSRPAKIVLAILAGVLIAAWALIIWIATVVTETMLGTLAYIVDLAAMTP